MIYTRETPFYSYSVEYPENWSVFEQRSSTLFVPPGADSINTGIMIIVIDLSETPPPPVHYTYSLVRNVRVGEDSVRVQKRDPSSIIERYFAEIKHDPYTIEFRYQLNAGYDDVFNHMLTSFHITTP